MTKRASWGDEELRILKTRYLQGSTPPEISKYLKRPVASVYSRLRALGLVKINPERHSGLDIFSVEQLKICSDPNLSEGKRMALFLERFPKSSIRIRTISYAISNQRECLKKIAEKTKPAEPIKSQVLPIQPVPKEGRTEQELLVLILHELRELTEINKERVEQVKRFVPRVKPT
jgi:hypothetical protein